MNAKIYERPINKIFPLELGNETLINSVQMANWRDAYIVDTDDDDVPVMKELTEEEFEEALGNEDEIDKGLQNDCAEKRMEEEWGEEMVQSEKSSLVVSLESSAPPSQMEPIPTSDSTEPLRTTSLSLETRNEQSEGYEQQISREKDVEKRGRSRIPIRVPFYRQMPPKAKQRAILSANTSPPLDHSARRWAPPPRRRATPVSKRGSSHSSFPWAGKTRTTIVSRPSLNPVR